eukprot:scaffold248291_cov19-Tisochrysis_lutea.AAC.1
MQDAQRLIQMLIHSGLSECRAHSSTTECRAHSCTSECRAHSGSSKCRANSSSVCLTGRRWECLQGLRTKKPALQRVGVPAAPVPVASPAAQHCTFKAAQVSTYKAQEGLSLPGRLRLASVYQTILIF